MGCYDNFASVYDLLMRDADYEGRTEYLLKLFEKYGTAPTLLLDVACGTGGFSNLFAQKGIEVIGVDMSEEMLMTAGENAAELDVDVLYLCQKAEELDLFGTVDGAICCLDSVNHITDKKELQRSFDKISLFLEPQKLFIFDVNTEYKHEKVLADNLFVMDEEDVYCVWQNSYNKEKKITDITLDFFIKDGDVYERSGEEFSERVYDFAELTQMIEKSGMSVVAIFDDMTENPVCDTTERAIFVCRKK